MPKSCPLDTMTFLIMLTVFDVMTLALTGSHLTHNMSHVLMLAEAAVASGARPQDFWSRPHSHSRLFNSSVQNGHILRSELLLISPSMRQERASTYHKPCYWDICVVETFICTRLAGHLH